MEKNMKKNIYVHNIVNQLHFNKIRKQKVLGMERTSRLRI